MSRRLKGRLERLAARCDVGCRSCGGKGRSVLVEWYDGEEPESPPPCPECGAPPFIIEVPLGPRDDAEGPVPGGIRAG
jgi:hypothetical protein